MSTSQQPGLELILKTFWRLFHLRLYADGSEFSPNLKRFLLYLVPVLEIITCTTLVGSNHFQFVVLASTSRLFVSSTIVTILYRAYNKNTKCSMLQSTAFPYSFLLKTRSSVQPLSIHYSDPLWPWSKSTSTWWRGNISTNICLSSDTCSVICYSSCKSESATKNSHFDIKVLWIKLSTIAIVRLIISTATVHGKTQQWLYAVFLSTSNSVFCTRKPWSLNSSKHT